MSQIKINEIESATNNADLTITPNGTGVFEVAGEESDGSLELNSVGNTDKVKIKSPPTSVAQNYTMILPASDITANRFLRVNNISGSGSSAIGQLELYNFVPADLTQLNADDFTSGTLATDRYTLTGSQGAGYQLVSKTSVTQADTITSIEFSNLEDGGMYKLFMYFKKDPASPSYADYPIAHYDSPTGSAYASWRHYLEEYAGSSNSRSGSNGATSTTINPNGSGHMCIEMEFFTKTPTASNRVPSWVIIRAVQAGDDDNKYEAYLTGQNVSSSHQYFNRFDKIRFTSGGSTANYYFDVGTEVCLYKYNEAS